MKSKKLYSAMVLALLFCLCACGRTSSYNSYGGATATPAASSAAPASGYLDATEVAELDMELGDTNTEAASLDQSIEGITAPDASDGRKIITTINLRMESKEYDKSANAIFDTVKAVGGYIEFSDIAGDIAAPEAASVSAFGSGSLNLVPLGAAPDFEIRSDGYREGDRRFMQLRIRIPQTNLSGFLSQLEACGNVLSKQESAEDITLQYVDVESHISALTSERDRLLVMLEKAENVEEMIALEKRLSEIRYQLERYESTLRVYKNQITYATINLTLNEVLIYTEKPESPVTMSERISVGWNQTLQDIENYWKNWAVWIVVNLIYIIPVLIGIVILIIILRKLIRRFLAFATTKTPSSKEKINESSIGGQTQPEGKKKE